jgi:exonuclease III
MLLLLLTSSASPLCVVQYRLEDFNVAFFAYLNELRALKPVILTGDLNVATFDEDIYNVVRGIYYIETR